MNIIKPKHILSIDPANNTGWCIFNKKCKIIKYGFFTIKSTNFLGDQLIEMMVKIMNLIKENNIGDIVVEDYFFSRKFRNGCNVNPAYRSAIYIIVRLMGLQYTIINPIDWKKFIVGRVKPTKEEIKLYGKEKAKKIIVRNALKSKYSITFPDIIQNENGKDIALKYDIVDAVAIGIYYIRSMGDP